MELSRTPRVRRSAGRPSCIVYYFCVIPGWLLILAGLPIMLMPVPLGLPMVLCGLSLLVSVSRTARRSMRRLRSRHPGLSQRLEQLHPYLPGFLQRLIERTRPRDAPRKCRLS